MICLEVLRNGVRICTAGLPDGILSANLMRGSHIGEPPRWGVELDVSAFSGEVSAEWLREALFPGDEVTIRIIEAEEADPPAVLRSEDEFAALVDKRGLLVDRTIHAALKRRIIEIEQQWGDRL